MHSLQTSNPYARPALFAAAPSGSATPVRALGHGLPAGYLRAAKAALAGGLLLRFPRS